MCTTSQENCQLKYLPNHFTHDRFSHMTDLRWNQEVKYFLGGGGCGELVLQGAALRHPNFRVPPPISVACYPSLPHRPLLLQGACGAPHLEMEDASVAILEALAMWNYSVQEGVIEGKGGDGSQEPTVPWDGKDPRQVYSTRLRPVSAILGRTWDSPGRVSLNLQKRPRNLGKPAPALRARACSGLQEGKAEAEQEGMGTGNYYAKHTRNPPGPTQCTLADVCAGGSIHNELGV